MADLDPNEYTVEELRDELDGIDDPDALEELREAESDGENRTGAKDAIDERLEAVSDDQQGEGESGDGDGTSAGIVDIRNHVRDDAGDLIGRPLDGIVEIERNEGDWRALVEIVERRSVPDTQDILGRYALELDGDGVITGYHRLDRYRRGDTRSDETGAPESY
ncbi:MAG TPA: gas vesicle protein GvpO [Halococcus sp.]|nr:gas vesicle protein GvpO [Halococcus sp.]